MVRVIAADRVKELVSPALAMAAAREALIAAAGESISYPVSLFPIDGSGKRISVKSAVFEAIPGIKIGTLWPLNPGAGLPSHGSSILLFDPENGCLRVVVEAGSVNALRTAAADAVATAALARPDASTLCIIGTGEQAFCEAIALRTVRPIRRVLVVGRSRDSERRLIQRLAREGVGAEPSDAHAGCRAADIIVTATPARQPLFESTWIRSGTHISAIGADGPGKQELPASLLRHAHLFCDLPSQAVTLGECQAVADEVAAGTVQLTPIGKVLGGACPGRTDDGEITVFDSSGLALQDVCLALRVAEAEGA